MDIAQARIDIMNWITSFVEQPHPLLDGWPPCPFARQARVNGQLDIRPGQIDPYTDLHAVTMDDWEVLIYVYDPVEIDADRFESQIDRVNRGFLIPRDMIALADHPGSPEQVRGVTMNQGTYALALVQSVSKLDSFARQIAPKGYYNSWPETYLEALFQHRQDPRT